MKYEIKKIQDILKKFSILNEIELDEKILLWNQIYRKAYNYNKNFIE